MLYTDVPFRISFALDLLANKKERKRVKDTIVKYTDDVVHRCAVSHVQDARKAVRRNERFMYNLMTVNKL